MPRGARAGHRHPGHPRAERALALLLLAALLLPSALRGQAASSATLMARVNTITSGTVGEHVGYLASDALLGRNTPSPGLDAAAAYLVERYRTWGLQPAGENGTYLQRFPYAGAMVPNVVAMIPGRDPALRGEYVVLSAHLDHVGIGSPVAGDSIYNGADDNASGTTALLEVARVLASLPAAERPARTVVFLHVSGEEKGLLGSAWWVDRPTLSVAGVVANLNLDMVGGNAHPDTVAALGGEYSTLGPLIREVNARHPELRLTPSGDLWPQEQLFYRSDQLNFMRREIPALFLFNGLHECYHRPCDEPDFIDADKLARVAKLVAYTVVEIGNRDRRPTWNLGALNEVRRMTGG